MRRVLVLINNSGLGGTERRLGRLFASLAKNEKDTVFVLNRRLWDKLVAGGLISPDARNVIRLAEPFEWLSRALPWLNERTRFWIRKLDYLSMASWLLLRYGFCAPHLFHVVLGGTYVALPLMTFRRDHRYVTSVTDHNIGGQVEFLRAFWWLLKSMKNSHAVDALTEGIAASLVREGVDAGTIVYSQGSVVDVTQFRPTEVKSSWVVFAGRLVEEKNPLLFLEAVPIIDQAVPGAKYFVLGEGPLKQAVQDAVKHCCLGTAIVTGFVENLAQILAQTKIFVSLQRRDNYPSQALLEAMASGAAIVATDVGMTWRLVDERTGIRVRQTAESVASAVIDLLRDPDRCQLLGQAARRLVSEYHSEEQYRDYLRDLHGRVDTTRDHGRPRFVGRPPTGASVPK
jgi:glycosyltransferase involved in cell wall biosynthesis